MKKFKYDYDSLPEEWKAKNKNIFEGMLFLDLGLVKTMPGHNRYVNINTGKKFILDAENMRQYD